MSLQGGVSNTKSTSEFWIFLDFGFGNWSFGHLDFGFGILDLEFSILDFGFGIFGIWYFHVF